MKAHIKFIFFLFALCLVTSTFTAPVFAAPAYNDVSESHPAYESIIKIALKGILVSDASGNYRPDDFIDKFETAKILAGLAGYRQIDPTAAEKDYYDRAYEKNRGLISQYGKNFKKWKSSTDREIAFLIEKEILTPEDLNQFVVIRNGEEVLRALSKEEAAVFMVRLTDKKTQALSTAGLYTFPALTDDLRVTAAYKPYVYFMLRTEMMKLDEQNYFTPKQAVTRADMAVLLDRVLSAAEDLDPDNRAEAPRIDADGTEPVFPSSVIETVTGTFDRLFENDAGAVQIIRPDGEKQLYKLSPAVAVYIDGFIKTASDLKQGMQLTAVLNNLFMIEIKAGENLQPVGAADAGAPDDFSGSVRLSVVEGVVVSVSTDAVIKTINLEVKMIGADSQVITDTKSYAVQENCAVERAGEECGLKDIKIGDICKAEVSGVNVYSISLEAKLRDINGKLIQKKETESGFSLTISGDNGSVYELKADGETVVTRADKSVSAGALRIGDEIAASAEYDRLLSVSATGKLSSVSGIIEEIRINRSGAVITLQTGETAAEYRVLTDSADIYALHAGAAVKLFLDSSEAYAITVESDEYSKNFLNGVITEKRGFNITVSDDKGQTRSILIDSETVITDSLTGEWVTPVALGEGDYIYAFINGATVRNVTIVIRKEN